MHKFKEFYNIRDISPGDENFVLATFLRGLYHGNSWFSQIPKDIFMINYKQVATILVKDRSRTNIKIACLKDDPTIIIGYSILSFDYQTIHFVYVKKAWRNNGVARSLVPSYPTAVTHLTEIGKDILLKFKDCIFNPFLT